MIKRNQAPPTIWRNPIHLSAFGLGFGASPWAPGTVGTLPAIPLVWLMSELPLTAYLITTFLLYAAGVWVSAKTTNDLGIPDHPGIVIDEIVGYLITMTAVPINIWTLTTGFLIFRFFDIVKPWPIRHLEKIPGGTGIMIDDAAAGAISLIIMQLIHTQIIM